MDLFNRYLVGVNQLDDGDKVGSDMSSEHRDIDQIHRVEQAEDSVAMFIQQLLLEIEGGEVVIDDLAIHVEFHLR